MTDLRGRLDKARKALLYYAECDNCEKIDCRCDYTQSLEVAREALKEIDETSDTSADR